MTLVYITLVIIGLTAAWCWAMYSAGVHGHFRFRWNEWENWALLAVALLCFGLPLRALFAKRST